MRKTVTFFRAGLLLLPVKLASAQAPGALQGTVTSAATGDPVPFASILVENSFLG